jgi:hypothetical protein
MKRLSVFFLLLAVIAIVLAFIVAVLASDVTAQGAEAGLTRPASTCREITGTPGVIGLKCLTRTPNRTPAITPGELSKQR